MSYLLHPPLLDEMGLAGALQWYTHGLTDRSGLKIDLNVEEAVGRLAPEVELVIFRIVQECLTNVHRHSGSKNAVIALQRSNGSVAVVVQDSEKGMSAEQLATAQTCGSGVGLRGMQERVRQFHGTMNLEPNGTGTKVKVTLPAPVEARSSDVVNPGLLESEFKTDRPIA
jgi:signal transduction histidine kinase